MNYEQAYNEAARQRDAYARVLERLLYAIQSGFYNSWDLNHKGQLKERGWGKKPKEDFHLGPSRASEWRKICRVEGAFHLGQLLQVTEEAEIDLAEIGETPAEIAAACKAYTLEKIKADLKAGKKPQKMGWTLRKIAANLFVILNECPIGKGLPGDEGSIYQEAFAAVWYALCEHVEVDPTDKRQLLDLIHEYDPEIKVEWRVEK